MSVEDNLNFYNNLLDDDMEPAMPDVDYSNFPTEPPEEEPEPMPPETDFAGTSIDPAVHDFSPVEDYIAEQEQYEREQAEIDAEIAKMYSDVLDDFANDFGSKEDAATALDDIFDKAASGMHVGNLSVDDFERVFGVGPRNDTDSNSTDNHNSVDQQEGKHQSDGDHVEHDEDPERKMHIDKMEQAHAKIKAIDTGFSKDSFVAIERFKETYHAYKAGVDIDKHEVHLSDVVESFARMMNSSMSETLILKLIDKIEEKIHEWKDEKDPVDPVEQNQPRGLRKKGNLLLQMIMSYLRILSICQIQNRLLTEQQTPLRQKILKTIS